MISFFSKHRKIIFLITVAIFLVGVFVGLGAYMFTGTNVGVVADVGGSKIPYQKFALQVDRAMEQFRDSGSEVNAIMSKTVKQEILREMIIEELLSKQAKTYGMRVSDFEIAVEVQNTPAFRAESGFSPRAYYETIWKEFHMAPSEYEAWRKKARLSGKFKQLIFTSVKVTPAELRAYYMSKNKGFANFEKDKDKYLEELTRDKFAQVANYMLKQLTLKVEVRNYLEQIEKGQQPS